MKHYTAIPVFIADDKPDEQGQIIERVNVTMPDIPVPVTGKNDHVIGEATLQWDGDTIVADIALDDRVDTDGGGAGITPAVFGEGAPIEGSEGRWSLTIGGIMMGAWHNADRRIGPIPAGCYVVPCPKCKAPGGKRCNPSTLGRHRFHKARVDAYGEQSTK